jgi:hypothetical protein
MNTDRIWAKTDFDALAQRLAAKAEALAKARIARRHTRQRWRSARLLWPLFTGGNPWR